MPGQYIKESLLTVQWDCVFASSTFRCPCLLFISKFDFPASYVFEPPDILLILFCSSRPELGSFGFKCKAFLTNRLSYYSLYLNRYLYSRKLNWESISYYGKTILLTFNAASLKAKMHQSQKKELRHPVDLVVLRQQWNWEWNILNLFKQRQHLFLCMATQVCSLVSPNVYSRYCLGSDQILLIPFTASVHPACSVCVLLLLMAYVWDSFEGCLWVTGITLCLCLKSCQYPTASIPQERLLAVDWLMQGYKPLALRELKLSNLFFRAPLLVQAKAEILPQNCTLDWLLLLPSLCVLTVSPGSTSLIKHLHLNPFVVCLWESCL